MYPFQKTALELALESQNFLSNISELTELCDFVSKDSWFSIALLKIDDRFLEKPVESWANSQAYRASLIKCPLTQCNQQQCRKGSEAEFRLPLSSQK